jgi:uncharacterized protein YggL (DUF469 family)
MCPYYIQSVDKCNIGDYRGSDYHRRFCIVSNNDWQKCDNYTHAHPKTKVEGLVKK